MKTRRSAGPGDVLHQLAEVLAVLEGGEDPAQLLGRGELGLGHHVEEAVAEELLHGRRVEVAEEVQGPLARSPHEGEDRVVGRRVLEPAQALGEIGGWQSPDAGAVEPVGRFVQLAVGDARVDRQEGLLHGTLVEHHDEAGHPLADPDELDPADPGGAGLGRRRNPGRSASPRRASSPRAGTTGRWRTRPGRTGGGSSAARRAGAAVSPTSDLDVEAVAGIGRHAPGGRVRVPEEALRLQLGQDVAHGRRADAQGVALDERLRSDRRGGGDVFLDDGQQDRLRTERRAGRCCGGCLAPRQTPSRTSVRPARPLAAG